MNHGDLPKLNVSDIDAVDKKSEEQIVLRIAKAHFKDWKGHSLEQKSYRDATTINKVKMILNKNDLRQEIENNNLQTEKLINALKVKLADKKLTAFNSKLKKQSQILKGVWILIGIQTLFLFIVIFATLSCVIFNSEIFKSLKIDEVKTIFSFIKFFTGATLSEFIAILFFITKNVYNDSFNLTNNDLEDALKVYENKIKE